MIRDVYLGSGFSISDPGVKKVLDPGFGSATLGITHTSITSHFLPMGNADECHMK